MAAIKYKGSDGEFHLLNNILVKGIDIVQTSGTSSGNVMSQKAVTEIVSGINDTLTAHTSDTDLHLTEAEKANIDSLANNIETVSGISSTDVENWDSAYEKVSGITASTTAINSLSGTVGTMAYEDKNSYSSATEVNTALGNKSDTGHTHTSNEITAMTNYTSGSTNTPIQTSDSLNTAIGKLEHSLGGVKIVTITQAAYDALVQADTVDPTTLYVITD